MALQRVPNFCLSDYRVCIASAGMALFGLSLFLPTFRSSMDPNSIKPGYVAAISAPLLGLAEGGIGQGICGLIFTFGNVMMLVVLIFTSRKRHPKLAVYFGITYLCTLLAPSIYNVSVFSGFYIWSISFLYMAWAMLYSPRERTYEEYLLIIIVGFLLSIPSILIFHAIKVEVNPWTLENTPFLQVICFSILTVVPLSCVAAELFHTPKLESGA